MAAEDLTRLLGEAQKLVNLLLRYVLAGGASIITFGLLNPNQFKFLTVDAEGTELSVVLTLFLVIGAGATIYTFHRALPYRIILPLFHRILRRSYHIDETSQEIEKRLRTTALERRQANDSYQTHFDILGAEIHFLYCSAWGCAIGTFLAKKMGAADDAATLAQLIAAMLFFAAVVHDWAMTSSEMERAYPASRNTETSSPKNGLNP